ncbi:MAG: hypothetical protein ABRQ27_05170 [Clostridiaceae bacterium]
MSFEEINRITTFKLNESHMNLLKKIQREFKFSISEVKDSENITQQPAYFIVINPESLSIDQLKKLAHDCENLKDTKVVLVYRVPGLKLPKNMAVIEDFFHEPGKARLNILNAYQKAKKIEKATKSVFVCRIRRVLELVRFMEKREIATREELLKKFKVSQRTLQRDMELLAAIKEPVLFDKDKKVYRYMKKELNE